MFCSSGTRPNPHWHRRESLTAVSLIRPVWRHSADAFSSPPLLWSDTFFVLHKSPCKHFFQRILWGEAGGGGRRAPTVRLEAGPRFIYLLFRRWFFCVDCCFPPPPPSSVLIWGFPWVCIHVADVVRSTDNCSRVCSCGTVKFRSV